MDNEFSGCVTNPCTTNAMNMTQPTSIQAVEWARGIQTAALLSNFGKSSRFERAEFLVLSGCMPSAGVHGIMSGNNIGNRNIFGLSLAEASEIRTEGHVGP